MNTEEFTPLVLCFLSIHPHFACSLSNLASLQPCHRSLWEAWRFLCSQISTVGTRNVKHTGFFPSRGRNHILLSIQKAWGKFSFYPGFLCTICLAKTTQDTPQTLIMSLPVIEPIFMEGVVCGQYVEPIFMENVTCTL